MPTPERSTETEERHEPYHGDVTRLHLELQDISGSWLITGLLLACYFILGTNGIHLETVFTNDKGVQHVVSTAIWLNSQLGGRILLAGVFIFIYLLSHCQ